VCECVCVCACKLERRRERREGGREGGGWRDQASWGEREKERECTRGGERERESKEAFRE